MRGHADVVISYVAGTKRKQVSCASLMIQSSTLTQNAGPISLPIDDVMHHSLLYPLYSTGTSLTPNTSSSQAS